MILALKAEDLVLTARINGAQNARKPEDHDLCAVASPRPQRDGHIEWPGGSGGCVWGGWEVSKPTDGQLGTCFISR